MNLHTNDFKERITRNHLSLEDRVAIVNFMKKKLRKLDNDKYVYVAGYNDQMIANRFKGKATILNIINVRKEIFGPLGQYPRVKKKKEVQMTYKGDIDSLNARVRQLEYQLGVFMRHYFTDENAKITPK